MQFLFGKFWIDFDLLGTFISTLILGVTLIAVKVNQHFPVYVIV